MLALGLVGVLASGASAPRLAHARAPHRTMHPERIPITRAIAMQAVLRRDTQGGDAQGGFTGKGTRPQTASLGSPVEYREAVEESMRLGKWQLGIDLFEQCERMHDMPAVSHAALVSAAVSGLCRHGRVRVACNILLSTLSRDVATQGGLGAALDVGAVHALLDACASTAGLMREASAVVRQLSAVNATVDAKTYCILIKGFGRSTDARGVGTTLRGMRAAGVSPDVITCNAALDAYARANAPDDAAALMTRMEQRAGGLPGPNIRSYNALLKAYARSGRLDKAAALAQRMRAQTSASALESAEKTDATNSDLGTAGFDPELAFQAAVGNAPSIAAPRYLMWNQISLNTLIDAYARAGELDSALALLLGEGGHRWAASSTLASGVRAGAHAYTSVLVALARERRLADALQLFEAMKSSCVPPTAISYNALIGACARLGDNTRARALLTAMQQAGGELKPDAQAYNALIAGLCRTAHLSEEALQGVPALVVEMEAAGLAPDCRTFNALLGALARRADGRGAEAIAARMAASDVDLTIHSHTALLSAHGASGDLEGVVTSWERLLASRLPVDRTAWHEYMRSCLLADHQASRAGSTGTGSPVSAAYVGEAVRRARVRATSPGAALALEALEAMRRGAGEPRLPLPPDAFTYAILVHGLSRTRAGAAEAWRLYGQMRASQIRVDAPCARALMIAAKRFVGVEAAVQLILDLEDDGWSEQALKPLRDELSQIETVAQYTVDERWKAAGSQPTQQQAGQGRLGSGNTGGTQAPLSGKEKKKRDPLFERHGWNEFENGFRVL